MAYQEGQRLQGSDGKVYVVHGGLPMLESSVTAGSGPVTLGTPKPGSQNVGPKSDAELRAIDLDNAKKAAGARWDAQNAANDAIIKGAAAQKAQQDQADREAAAAIKPSNGTHGPAYLATLSPERAALVRGYATGNLTFGQRPLATPESRALLQDVVNYDPSFDMTDFQARAKAKAAFMTGKFGQMTTSLNTSLPHSAQVLDDVRALGNTNLPAWNAVRNPVETFFGATAPTNLANDMRAFGGELGTTFANGTSGEGERQGWSASIGPNEGYNQQLDSLRHDAKLINSRREAIEYQARQSLGPYTSFQDLVSPEAKAAYDKLMAIVPGQTSTTKSAPGATGGVVGPGGPGGSGGGGGNGPMPGPAQPPAGGPPMVLATGSTKAIDTSRVNAVIDGMIRSGASDSQITAAIQPLGFGAVDPRQTKAARDYLAKNPGYTGSFGAARATAPTTTWERVKNNPFVQGAATGALAASDAALFGMSDEIGGAAKSLVTGRPMSEEIAGLNAAKQAAFANNPGAALTGETLGTIGSMSALGGRLAAGAARLGLPRILAPVAADVTMGAAQGAGQDNDNRGLGAFIGGVGALGGNLVGQVAGRAIGAAARTTPGIALTNRVGGMAFRGFNPITAAAPLTSAEGSTVGLIDKAGGLPSITGQLTEAQNLGVPLSLADVHPEFRELAGAAVRRSPTASAFAENNLIPRSRGQYDRFTSAVDQNLGSTVNIPQRSADLTAQARTAAGPLYDAAYAQPVPSTPELTSTLNTPFGQQALARARTIAGNERRNPAELGFAQDENGNTILNPQPNQAIANHLGARANLDAAQDAYRTARQTPGADTTQTSAQLQRARDALRQSQAALNAAPDPSLPASVPAYTTQTLDYVKRGMDDVLEDQRNPITGKLVLDEAGRAQNGLKNQFLAELDRLNPAYANARAAYAGPVTERSNMAAGQDAYTANPQQLGVDIAGSSPERLGQMQLGYQGALVDHAGQVRDSGNSWEATLGSPMARDRLATMYPGSPAVPVLLRQRELEGGMQQTTNAILGNSRTARNLAADQSFAGSPYSDAAMHAGLAIATHGASVPATVLQMARTGVSDWWKLGRGASAVAKADDLAPILMNPDPAAASASLQDMLARVQAYSDFQNRTTPTRALRMFGAGLGSQAALATLPPPLTYGAGG